MRGGAWRMGAFAIAAMAVVDPALTSSRSDRPTVSVITADSATSASLGNRVAQALDRRFTVVRGRFDAAAATVVVGRAVPDDAGSLTGAIVAVVPAEARSSVRVVNVEAPAGATLNARVPVRVEVSVTGARGRRLTVQLRANDAIVDQAVQGIEIDSGRLNLELRHVPLSTGAQVLAVNAFVEGGAVSDSSFTVVDARSDRYAILFYDPRPSWSSTFVRRAVEQDARFSITHRVVTSRGVSNAGGAAPESLRDVASLPGYSTIVVGAPETLTASEVASLETYMRRRGGSVVVLMEGTGVGQFDRLTGVSDWRTSRTAAITTFADDRGYGALRGRETTWPAVTPAGSASYIVHMARDSSRHAVVWSVPVGAGRLMVSGALDAWQHRGDSSGFNAFWATVLAELSSSAPPAVSVALSRRAMRPGELTTARITLRETLLSGGDVRTGNVGAALVSAGDSIPVRLWPERTPGVFSGAIVAPRQSGDYRLVAWTDTERGEAPLVVAAGARTPVGDDRDVLRSFVSSRGGIVVSEDAIDGLSSRLSSAIRPVSRVETWHPMRSPWWIVPFALLLGAEWWIRRRSGLV